MSTPSRPQHAGVAATSRTATALLAGLRDSGDAEAWGEFDRRYRPVVLGVARRLGLDEADAADVAQETVLQFMKDYRAGSFDRARGRLRAWIAGIARHRVQDVMRREASRRERRGDSALAAAPAEDEFERLWEQECRQEMLRGAMEQLRVSGRVGDKGLAVLELLFVRRVTPAAAAGELGVSVQDVYATKSRLAERLREMVEAQRAAFEEA